MRLPTLSTTLLTFSLFISPISAFANPLNATISKVVDGDTVTVTSNGSSFTLQLACIDAPDWVDGKAQPNAESSKNRLTQLLPVGSSIGYHAVGTVRGNRVLAIILKGNSNINLQMVAEGQAQLHPSYQSSCPNLANELSTAQSNAQSRGLGIWKR
jgi:micrococcal nuclease